MNTFPLICLLLTLPPAFASLPAPVNLEVKSLNFQNVLHWEPGPGSPPGTQFRIFRGVDGGKQKRIRKLINSTSEELELDILGTYQLAVRAYYNHTHSRLSKSITFAPLYNSVIGPPLLSVAGCGTCIKGNISLPDERIQTDLDPSFRVLWRKGNDKETQFQELKIRERNFTLSNLEKDVEYCVQVHIEIRVNKNTVPTGWNCTFTSVPQPEKGMLILVLVTTFLIVFLIVLSTGIFCLYYTGFLCKLKEMPAALMVVLWPDYVLTPSTTDLNQVFIYPQTVKPRNCPTRSPSSTGEADPEDEDGDEEGVVNLYMDRNAELSSDGGSHQNSADSSGNLGESATRDCSGFAEKEPAEVEERWAETDRYKAKAEAAQPSFVHDGEQPGLPVPVMVQDEEEMNTETQDFSGNINLLSVTLASMTTCEEDEVEEDQDSGSSSTDFLRIYTLKLLSQTDSQSEQDDQISAPLTHPSENFTTSGYEGKCVESWMDEDEEEEEEEFSGYLTNR